MADEKPTPKQQVNIRLHAYDVARVKAKAEEAGDTLTHWIETAVLDRLDEGVPKPREYKVPRGECSHKRLPQPKPGTATSKCPDCGTDIEQLGIGNAGLPKSGLGGRLVP